MKDSFLLFSKLSELLNFSDLLNANLTNENCLKSAECVRKRLGETRLEVEHLMLKATRKKAAAYVRTYQHYLLRLAGMLEQKLLQQEFKTALSGDADSYFSAPQYTVLKVISYELEYLLVNHNQAFDFTQLMPAVSRTGFCSGFGPETTAFLERVRQDLNDKALANIICDFVRSFDGVSPGYSYTFSDRNCVLSLFSLLIPTLNSEVCGDKSATVRVLLMVHGFNFPPFVSYCGDWLDSQVDSHRGDTGACMSELGRLQNTVFRMCDRSLSLKEYPLLQDQCNAWIEKQTALCTSKKKFESSVERAVAERMNSLKLKIGLTVKEMGIIVESLCEQNLFVSSKKRVVEFFALMFYTGKSEEISGHSFSNGLYCKDWKLCSTAIAYLEKSIELIRRKADL